MTEERVTGDLGAFLRHRRDTLSPAEVGLPEGARRRTPGLRRSEVATLAGISVEYLTRLEQGRDRHPSVRCLQRCARRYGCRTRTSPTFTCSPRWLAPASAPGPPPARHVRANILAVLQHLEPAPALLLDRLSTILAFTTGFERLARPVGLLDSDPANLARYVFTDPRARTTYPHWDLVADYHAAQLRSQATWDAVHTAPLVEQTDRGRRSIHEPMASAHRGAFAKRS